MGWNHQQAMYFLDPKREAIYEISELTQKSPKSQVIDGERINIIQETNILMMIYSTLIMFDFLKVLKLCRFPPIELLSFIKE